MARGVKKLTLEEQLEKVTNDIEECEKSLKGMKALKEELEEKVHQKHLSELENLIKEKGYTIEDVAKMLTDKE